MTAEAGGRHPGRCRPRIVFLNRFYAPDVSASSQMLTGLAEWLAAAGYEVAVVCSRQRYEDARAGLALREERHGVRVRRVRSTGFGRGGLFGRAADYLSFGAAAAVALCALLRPGDLLVAKTDPPMLSVLGAVVARLKRARLLNWLQDLFPEVAVRLAVPPVPAVLERALLALRDRSLHAAAMNVVLGERMRGYLVTRGVSPERVVICPNWADGNQVRVLRPESSRLRSECGLAGRFVIEYSGNLGRAHEYATLLDAAEELAGDPEVAFLMVGGGAKMQGLEQEAARRGLGAFRFAPYQPQEALGDALAAGDVHLVSLLPCLEGLIVPSKLYGILAAGRPVVFVGDADGEVARFLRARDCGLSVACGQGSELAKVLRGLKLDAAERHRMGERARRAFDEDHDLPASAARWRGVLEGVGFAASPEGSAVARPQSSA
jgi:glycosyltransferase involved in cell wall biosynthesis